MDSLIVTLVQTELHWENKVANIAHFSKLIESIGTKTDIIMLPEMFTTGFSMQPGKLAESMDGATVSWMLETAAARGAVVTGSCIILEKGRYYNRLIWAQPDGKVFHYDKRHLFGLSNEHKHYSAGSRKLIVKWKDWTICPMICYDLRFPVWCRNAEGYEVLLFVANWPERRNVAWKILLQARAIENQSYVVGVNRIGYDGNGVYHSGDSSIIDPAGEVIFTQSDLPAVKTYALSKERLLYVREKLPFLNDADRFSIDV
jgi:omega-amidase